jgi:hypothetical protein
MALTVDSFVKAFRKRHHWKALSGSRIANDLTAFAEARLGSTRNIEELYVIFCLGHGLQPYPQNNKD